MLIQNKKSVKILLTGGGTGGSVMPLLAIADQIMNEELRIINYKFLWLGTKGGPERQMVENAGIKFKAIFSGKLRRYFSLRNLIDPFLIKLGFYQSFFIMVKWKPDLVISAGSFVSVPVVWAAWFLRVPVLIHQQDLRSGLSNKLMALFAKVITVTFEKSLVDYGEKAVWTGNPVRQSLTSQKHKNTKTQNIFNFNNNLPVVLIIGGGTGALAINQLVEQGIEELVKFCQVVHITGEGKSDPIALKAIGSLDYYKNFKFLNAEQMAEAYAVADVVVSRCGMGVLTELSYLGKSAILIPIPDSHQEENAKVFQEKNAAVVLKQDELSSATLIKEIKNLINNNELRNKLGNNIKQVIKRGANEKIIKIIRRLVN